MQHIKDYWRESEVFHASNLNEIAAAINELIDKAETIIDDELASLSSTYSSSKIVELLENHGFKTLVVDELPETGENNTIYFVPSSDPREKDVTDEFIWCDGKWEQIGSTRVDFSNYYTKREIDDVVDTIEGMISEKADVLHEHQMEDVNGLGAALAGKSDTGHTHEISGVNGLQNALAGKSDTGHTHQVSEVSGLQTALDGKSNTGHTHGMSEVSGLNDALAGKSDTGHTHNEYSPTSHTHSEYSLTSHTHSEYSLTGHTHNIGEIDGLENTLAGKSDTGHTHSEYSLTGHTHSEYSPTGHTHGQYSLTSHTHTAAEIGALPDTTVIPTKTSQLTNDSGFLTEHQQLKTVNGESLVGTGNVTIIDDTQASLQKTYSSSKIDGMLAAPSVAEVLEVLNAPEPYDEGYLHGNTDSYSGETPNPHSAGTYSYTEWASGYTDGWRLNPVEATRRGNEAAYEDLVSGTTQNPYDALTETEAYDAWNLGYFLAWGIHKQMVYNSGAYAGGQDETSGATSNPYSAGTELNGDWTSGYTDTWTPRYQQAYTDGYNAGNTDPSSGATSNPFTAGSDLNGRWSAGYTQGWEDAHPEPQEETHYWFVYSGDAETNGVVIDRDMFTGMISGTSSLNSSFVVDGVTYRTTKRSSDAATFGNIVIPSGKTATIYLAAVSSGSAARKVLLTNDTTGYSGEFNIDGGSSSLKVATLTDVTGGLTYKLSRNGNENVRVSALIVKLQ